MIYSLKKFKNKRVLITGNTVFKGSWLSYWLNLYGAKVYGFADEIPSKPSFYEALSLKDDITQVWGDIRDFKSLSKAINNIKPDFIFHLAAQSLVAKSYDDPALTFSTNFNGTLNLLEIARKYSSKLNIVIITSDKSYKNIEQLWGYKENDLIGGIDPYSASKSATEMLISGYFNSYFKNQKKIKVAIARAGNVIGGGDWSENRIVPDAIRAWSKNKTLNIRNPKSTRPWQHVMEPLSGYITLANTLEKNPTINGEAFNFGPSSDQDYSVEYLLKKMQIYWPKKSWKVLSAKKFYESGLLKLNCEKANLMLNWNSALNIDENIEFTMNWYKNFYEKKDIRLFTYEQIKLYENIFEERNVR